MEYESRTGSSTYIRVSVVPSSSRQQGPLCDHMHEQPPLGPLGTGVARNIVRLAIPLLVSA